MASPRAKPPTKDSPREVPNSSPLADALQTDFFLHAGAHLTHQGLVLFSDGIPVAFASPTLRVLVVAEVGVGLGRQACFASSTLLWTWSAPYKLAGRILAGSALLLALERVIVFTLVLFSCFRVVPSHPLLKVVSLRRFPHVTLT